MIHKTVIAVLAFCVFATTAAFFASIEYHFGYLGGWLGAAVAQGDLEIGFATRRVAAGWFWQANNIVDPLIGLPHVYSRPGFSSIRIPLWLLFVLFFSAYLTIVFIRSPRRRWRRRRAGLCQKCGYDLTGNESGVCPECGEPL